MDRLSGYLPEDYVPTRSNGQRDKSNEDAQSDYSSSSSSASTYPSMSSSEDSEYLAAVEAEREWEENVRQLQLAVSVLILPTIGKWLGRKWSYWLYSRYIQVGWKWSLFLPSSWGNVKAV